MTSSREWTSVTVELPCCRPICTYIVLLFIFVFACPVGTGSVWVWMFVSVSGRHLVKAPCEPM